MKSHHCYQLDCSSASVQADSSNPSDKYVYHCIIFSVPTGLIGSPSSTHKSIRVVWGDAQITDFVHKLGFLDAKKTGEDSIKHFQKVYQVNLPQSIIINLYKINIHLSILIVYFDVCRLLNGLQSCI